MSQIIYPITHLPPVIDIGKQTEKGVTRIGFDVHEWLDDWPGMAFSVQPTRPGETESYFAASEMVGSVVFWLVGAVDTEKPGSGTVEVLGVTEDERKLSFMCRTSIANTNTATVAEIPEPNKPWVDRVILAADSAAKSATESEASADKAAASAKEAEESVQDFFIVTAAPKNEGVPVLYADKTQAEIREAVAAGKTCLLVYNASTSSVSAGTVCTYSGEDKYDADETESPCFFAGVKYNTQAQRWYQYTSYVRADGHVGTIGKVMRTQTSSVLKFTGAVNAQFDGTNPVTVDIPSNDVFVVKITHDGSKWFVDKTAAEIIEALIAGKACILTGYSAGATMPLLYVDGNDVLFGCYRHESFGEGMTGILLSLFRIKSDGTVETGVEFPATTPNPYPLHIIGAVEAEYDGSDEVVVEIPDAGLPETADPLKQLVTDADGNVAWEDRLAYKTTAEVVNLEETALTYGEDDGSFFLLSPWAADLMVGAVATVKYNGTDYECKTFDGKALQPDAQGKTVVMGNLAALGMEGVEGSNPNAPFALVAIPNGDLTEGLYGMLIPLDGATSVTLAVRSVDEIVKKIDEKYLPDNIVNEVPMLVTIDAATLTIDHPYAEVYAALIAGKHVQIRAGADGRYNVLTPISYSADFIGLLSVAYADTGFDSTYKTLYKINSDGTIEVVG